jgi:hypothetical protein
MLTALRRLLMTTATTLSPAPESVSKPQGSGRLTLRDVPTELRLVIWDLLLNANNIPRSYGYTGPVVPLSATDPNKLPSCPTHRHAMLFVSPEFSAEYRQCYYERTTFFLRIDENNAFRGAPQLEGVKATVDRSPEAVPNFWGAPDALLQNLRDCTLYIEIGNIASESVHGLAMAERGELRKSAGELFGKLSANDPRFQSVALIRPNTEVIYHTFGDPDPGTVPSAPALVMDELLTKIHAKNSIFNASFRDAILHLLSEMKQLRRVQLVWDTNRDSFATPPTELTDWTWDTMGKPIVDSLKAQKNLSYINVRLGQEFRWRGVRENKEWKKDLISQADLAT